MVKRLVEIPRRLIIENAETGKSELNQIEVDRFFRKLANTLNDHEDRITTLEP